MTPIRKIRGEPAHCWPPQCRERDLLDLHDRRRAELVCVLVLKDRSAVIGSYPFDPTEGGRLSIRNPQKPSARAASQSVAPSQPPWFWCQ
ncbi:hypothetical protein Y032_0060g3154 [Ancylostoma ceylanicum]|uniref:Uncharacterized protein n=1 Tax=Ancylostoma ceylanicum TaxID=53326 RepID=A0A016U319_9BILA|nr:hypothetical protein Y032_0060g3154 [Ancylostoma ceylanicum]